MNSLKRAVCRNTVLRTVTYRSGILTGHPSILCLRRTKFSRITFSQKTEERYKSIDKVPHEYELIYRAPMISYIQTTNVTSSFSILSLCIAGTYKYITDPMNTFPLTIKLNEASELGDIELDDNLFLVVSTFIIFNVCIGAVTLRYPLMIYHHEEANSYMCDK